MNRELAFTIADAVMYEGYVLYPYRSSALKNRQRWSFGILYPPDYEEVPRGTERSTMHSECLLREDAGCKLRVALRFLQLARKSSADASTQEEAADEAIARSLEFEPKLSLSNIQRFEFAFPKNGTLAKMQEYLRGVLTIAVERPADGLLKLRIDVTNEASSSDSSATQQNRDSALLQAFLSAHLILSVEDGEFISLLDPQEFAAYATSCRNIGNFPVLIGNEGERDMMLCSPIILYDYPQIAPESAGNFFDATEMDEMLVLRIMTLTDSEKDQMRSANEHVHALLQRTEQSAREQLMNTHGVIRNMKPVADNSQQKKYSSSDSNGEVMYWNPETDQTPVEDFVIFGIRVKRGDTVRIWPQKSADIMDIALKGKTAVIEAIERDYDDRIHVAVVLEDDPGRDLGVLRQPGHRFFFSPEELEPLKLEVPDGR